MKTRVFSVFQIEQIRFWQASLKDYEFISSSWAEICPWYRKGLGYFAFSRLIAKPLHLAEVLKILVGNAQNLVRKSYLTCRASVQVELGTKEWIFGWAISENDDVESCIDRYFGSAYAGLAKKSKVVACIFCAFSPSNDFLVRMVDQGAIVFYESTPSFKALLEMAKAALKLRSLVVLDAEYWRGFWISRAVSRIIAEINIKALNVRLPYEQQPWQLHLIKTLRKILGKNALVVGDVHSSMTSLPVQFSRMDIGPDQLYVHGKAYKRVLVTLLGWPAESIIIEPSRRFIRKLDLQKSTIFLPYDFSSVSSVVEKVKEVFAKIDHYPGSFDIKVHPARSRESSHLELAALLRQTICCPDQNGSKSQEPQKSLVLVVGVSTTLLEALEAGYDAIGVYEYPEYEVYSPDIWQELEIAWISEHAVRYTLKTPNAFIMYDEKDSL